MLLACAAHWYESLLFVAPVVGVGGAMRWASRRADREEAAAAEAAAPALAAERA